MLRSVVINKFIRRMITYKCVDIIAAIIYDNYTQSLSSIVLCFMHVDFTVLQPLKGQDTILLISVRCNCIDYR
jgi:hypothetical protein